MVVVTNGRPTARLARMSGRDTDEQHRAATPLELLFDLAFVIAFGQAANGLAGFIAHGQWAVGLGAFAFAVFAITWAWINYSWFASAFDTDDWLYRLTTMVQMVGVVIVALGLPPMFASLELAAEAQTPVVVDNGIMVAGYVVMRLAMLTQWLRAAAQAPELRRTALTYALFLALAQVGWLWVLVAQLPLGTAMLAGIALLLVEIAGPAIAERGNPTPWHAHHIVERYSLLAIIALGEIVVGTVISVSAVVEELGWSLDAALLALSGIAIAFAMWWIYFLHDHAPTLHRRRNARAFVWGYGSIVVFGSIAAVGAGLHVAAYTIEDPEHVPALWAVLAIAVPLALYVVALLLISTAMQGWTKHSAHLTGAVIALAALAFAIVLAAGGLSLSWCVLVVVLAPVALIVADEVDAARALREGRDRLGAARD